MGTPIKGRRCTFAALIRPRRALLAAPFRPQCQAAAQQLRGRGA